MHAKRAPVKFFFSLFFLHSHRLAAMRSASRDMSRRQPLTIEQRPELYRLTCQHCRAGIEPLGFFFGCQDHSDLFSTLANSASEPSRMYR